MVSPAGELRSGSFSLLSQLMTIRHPPARPATTAAAAAEPRRPDDEQRISKKAA
jgi:hypothetical protein